MVKNYEEIYCKDELYWGANPSDLVKRFGELAPAGAALDLGMGEGRDALYLAGLGLSVTGVDSTKSGVSKCSELARKKGLTLRAISEDVRKFKIAKNRYALIAAINLFQFLSKKDAQKIIEMAINGLKRGGLFVCESFTIDDPHYKAHKKHSKELAPGTFLDASGNVFSLYGYGEILRMCSPELHNSKTTPKMRPIHYAEYDFYDTTHGPAHWHGVVDYVGKKL
ncbi:MAG: class I SAM-dependent methyltransferase [Candidatus Zixiibacteriota bacterium]